METITITYNQIFQITPYFKSLEKATELTFSQRRKLIHLNEILAKEFNFLTEEMNKIADEFCEKDEEGNFVYTDDGSGQKIKEGEIDNCNKALSEVYNTQTEIQIQPFKLPEKFFENLRCDTVTTKLIEEYFLLEEE